MLDDKELLTTLKHLSFNLNEFANYIINCYLPQKSYLI